MEFTMWDKSMGIDKLELNYEAHMVGCDGEMFYYSIYFEDAVTEAKCEEVSNAVSEACGEDDDDYIGYIDIKYEDEMIFVYHDTGNVADCDAAVKIVLKSFNAVTGIKNVVINEGCDDFEDFEDFED